MPINCDRSESPTRLLACGTAKTIAFESNSSSVCFLNCPITSALKENFPLGLIRCLFQYVSSRITRWRPTVPGQKGNVLRTLRRPFYPHQISGWVYRYAGWPGEHSENVRAGCLFLSSICCLKLRLCNSCWAWRVSRRRKHHQTSFPKLLTILPSSIMAKRSIQVRRWLPKVCYHSESACLKMLTRLSRIIATDYWCSPKFSRCHFSELYICDDWSVIALTSFAPIGN
jgi:hypothetical protein